MSQVQPNHAAPHLLSVLVRVGGVCELKVAQLQSEGRQLSLDVLKLSHSATVGERVIRHISTS